MTTKSSGARPAVAVVLGMHRSGTSAIARGLQVVGVELGDCLVPPEAGNNDKGFWEDSEICALNIDMLVTLQRGWDCLLPLDAAEIDRLCAAGFVECAAALLRDKCGVRAIFGFKDPRTALLLPVWQRAFAHGEFDTRYVIALRNPMSVVRSLAKRDAFDETLSCLIWVNHMMSVLVGTRTCPAVVVDYDRLMASPEAELRRVAALLGTTTDARALELYRQDFLDESLRHSRHHLEELRADRFTVGLVTEIYGFLVEAAADRIRIDAPASSETIERFAAEWRVLRPLVELVDRQRQQRADDKRTHEQQLAEQAAKLAASERLIVERDLRAKEVKAGLEARAQQLSATIDSIRSSFSWRATEPVRRLVTAVKKVLRASGLGGR